MAGRPILTADEMRAAEEAVIAAGTSVETLMDRAGTAAADAIWRYAGPRPTLVICGPGNNGGDGYVIARRLHERGIAVRVAALSDPKSAAAQWARSGWSGPVEGLDDCASAPVLVDALFGTGLTRGLDAGTANTLSRLASEAAVRIAVDLPSGAATDDGQLLSAVPDYDLTVTFGALKPSHLLQPCARHIGRLVVADIGIEAKARLHSIARPTLAAPTPDDHKYSRGYVAVLEGAMPGAAALSASAAARAGAGYVRLIGSTILSNVPRSVVQGGGTEPLDDQRISALVVGPGLGTTDEAGQMLDAALEAGHLLVIDADALTLVGSRLDQLRALSAPAILTPHAGEFARLFGAMGANKVDAARRAARETGAVVIFKGADTVVAAPDGRAAIGRPGWSWLATAGTGDVLSGIVAAIRARMADPFEAACTAVWLHGRAAERAGVGLIADDLLDALPEVLAECV